MVVRNTRSLTAIALALVLLVVWPATPLTHSQTAAPFPGAEELPLPAAGGGNPRSPDRATLSLVGNPGEGSATAGAAGASSAESRPTGTCPAPAAAKGAAGSGSKTDGGEKAGDKAPAAKEGAA